MARFRFRELLATSAAGLLLVAQGAAQEVRPGGPYNAGVTVYRLPSNINVVTPRGPRFATPGTLGNSQVPRLQAGIDRTPRSQKLMERYEKSQAERLSRSKRLRKIFESRKTRLRTGASQKYLTERRKRQEGDRLTPAGLQRQPRGPTRELRKTGISVPKKKPPPKATGKSEETIAREKLLAERAERRRIMMEISERLRARKSIVGVNTQVGPGARELPEKEPRPARRAYGMVSARRR